MSKDLNKLLMKKTRKIKNILQVRKAEKRNLLKQRKKITTGN